MSLSLVVGCVGLGNVGGRHIEGIDIGNEVVATLHAAILSSPQTGKSVVGIGIEVGHFLPHKHVGRRSTTHVHLVRHYVGTEVDGVVVTVAPVGPVQGVVAGYKGFLNMGIIFEVGSEVVRIGIIQVKEALLTAGHSERQYASYS